jgi:hypothetical protein
MPIAKKEATIPASIPDQALPDFMNVFLHGWLFSAGYRLSSTCNSPEEVARGLIIDSNIGGPIFIGGPILFVVTNIDRSAGLIEYEMREGQIAGFKAYKAPIDITETEEPDQFHIHWQVDFKLKFIMATSGLGLARFAIRDQQKYILKDNLKRVREVAASNQS